MDKIICINSSNQTQLRENVVYNTDIKARCKCGLIVYGIVGIDNYAKDKDSRLLTLCYCGRKLDFNGKPVFGGYRFKKITVHCI